MVGNLDTTNLLLGILAAVSVLEAIALIVGGVMAYRLYARTLQTVQELEARHVAPLAVRAHALMTRIDSVMGDVKDVTERMPGQSRLSNLVTLASGAKQILGGLFNGRRSSGEAPGDAAQREDHHNGG
jgi:hypothetical protein